MRWYPFLCFLVLVLSTIATRTKVVPRIINGDVAEEGQFPWQVGVVSVNSSHLLYCGGAIISEQWILTAAHCINNVEDVTIMYDTLDLEDTDNQVKVTQKFLVHEEYDASTLKNDIGLVLVDSPFDFGGNVKAIALAEVPLEVGTEVTVSGWGTTGDDDNSDKFDVLRYISVTTIDNEKCMEAYGGIITDSVVCTDPGDPLKNPCKGDGGDPVVVYEGSEPVLVALFSFLSGLGCETADFPAAYTRVASYREWIRDLTGI